MQACSCAWARPLCMQETFACDIWVYMQIAATSAPVVCAMDVTLAPYIQCLATPEEYIAGLFCYQAEL